MQSSRRIPILIHAAFPVAIYGLESCLRALSENIPFIADNIFLPRHDAEAHAESLDSCDDKGWLLHHFEWSKEEHEEHFAFDQHPFGICAPRDCYDERTGAFALNPVSILDLSMKDEALRIKLSEHGVHESLMDGVADILYARGTPREEWVMPYHRAEPLHIAILGFPECGTTQLAYNLGLHPHIVFSELGNDVDVFQYGVMYASELQNFVADDPKYAQRLNELSFEQKHLLQVGITSPLSVYHRERMYTAARLGLKTIICIRHPYKMHTSAFAHRVDRKQDFEDYFKSHEFDRMSNVLYDHTGLFARENLMVVSLDNFIREPHETYEAIFKFIGVNPNEQNIMSSENFWTPQNVDICKHGDRHPTGRSPYEEYLDECFEDYHQGVAEGLDFKAEARRMKKIAEFFSHGIEKVYGFEDDEKFCDGDIIFSVPRWWMYKLREKSGNWVICSVDPRMQNITVGDEMFYNPCPESILHTDDPNVEYCKENYVVTIPGPLKKLFPEYMISDLQQRVDIVNTHRQQNNEPAYSGYPFLAR